MYFKNILSLYLIAYLCKKQKYMKDNPIITIDSEYIEWLKAIKQQIRSTKIRMIKTANTELIHFYWRLGQIISLKLKEQNWGDKVINKLTVSCFYTSFCKCFNTNKVLNRIFTFLFCHFHHLLLFYSVWGMFRLSNPIRNIVVLK